MIELAFVACVKTLMSQCDDWTIPYNPDVSMMACFMQAQPELAKWAETHPDLQVIRWSCQPAGQHSIRA